MFGIGVPGAAAIADEDLPGDGFKVELGIHNGKTPYEAMRNMLESARICLNRNS